MSMVWLKGEREGLDGYRDSNTVLPKRKRKKPFATSRKEQTYENDTKMSFKK